MSISTTATKVSYSGNNSNSTPYAITFKYLDVSHVTVYADKVDITTNCTFSGDGAAGTGQFTTDAAQAPTVTVTAVLDVPFDQPVVLQETGSLPAKTLEVSGFDRLNMQIRRVWRKATDALSFSSDEGSGSTGTADTLVGFDSSGDIAEIPNGTFCQTANNLSDVDAATARANLNVDPKGTDNSTDVTLAGTGTYITMGAGQVITVDPITESDISDLGAYITDITGENLTDLSDVTITTPALNQILSWNGSAWVNSSIDSGGGMLASVYDPTAVGGDAFAMDNMVEGANTKILTSTERTNIGSAMQPATYDPTAVGGDAFDSGNHVYTPAGTGAVATDVETKLRESVSVKDFGAVGDGVTDDTAAIQAAINYCISNNIELFVPDGLYLITSNLTIDGSLHIKGVEWEGYSVRSQTGAENTRGKGAYFYRDAYLGRLFVIDTITSVTFENVAFDENQPLPSGTFTPTEYDWNIFTGKCEGLVIKNVFFRKCRKGIRVDNSNGGAERLRIDGLYGQNLGIMVDIDFQSDVNRINDLHAWPYWSLDTVVRDYTRANADTIVSGRNDNPLWTNIFTIAQRHAIRFKNSTTSGAGLISNKVHLSNADLDVGRTGVYVDSGVSGVTMQMSNVTIQGGETIHESRGIEILGGNCRFDLSNVRITKNQKQSIRIAGTGGNSVRAENLECERWGGDGTSAALAVDSGNTLRLGHNFSFIPNLSSLRWSVGTTGKVFAASGDTVQVEKDATVQTLTSGTQETITWQTIVEDNVNTNINLGSNEITPKVPGLYRVRVSVGFDSTVDGSFHELSIRANGVIVAREVKKSKGNTFFTMDAEKTVRLNGASQTIRVSAQQNTGGAVNLSSDSDYTFLEVTRVG